LRVERCDVVDGGVEDFGGAEAQRRSRRDGTKSVTTIREAPKARAAWAQITPIGPAPAMRTEEPGTIPALRMVAIATESGSSSAAASSDMESGTGWAISAPMVT